MPKDNLLNPKDLFPSIGEEIHELLEDFNVIATPQDVVLVPNYKFEYSLSDNVYAAVVASSLGLSSIDYAKKTYCQKETENKTIQTRKLDSMYIDAYKLAKSHIKTLISRLNPKEHSLPSLGVFGASIVLERLPYSFFSAHLLYRLGHRYEAHAVSKLILEQIAWANTAYKLKHVSDIEKIITTKTITALKKTVPGSGNIYGYLNKKSHIDYDSHHDFIHIKDQENYILHTQHDFYEYAQVILCLADIFGIVWELSQYEYLTETESIQSKNKSLTIKKDRPFLKTIQSRLEEIEDANNKSIKKNC